MLTNDNVLKFKFYKAEWYSRLRLFFSYWKSSKTFLSDKNVNLIPCIHKILDYGRELVGFFEKEAETGTGVFDRRTSQKYD